MTLPDLDIRTWLIIGLSVVLLAVVLLVEPLRENLAAWLVWLGTVLGGGATEAHQPERERQEPEPDPVTVADDLEQETEQQVEGEQDPSGDDLHDDWEELGQ